MTDTITAAELEDLAQREIWIRPTALRRAANTIRQLEADYERIIAGSDAVLGALVRKINAHPMAIETVLVPAPQMAGWGVSPYALGRCLAHLDSLLPKESEPVIAPSGWRYRPPAFLTRDVAQSRDGGVSWFAYFRDDEAIPPCDREFVAKLMEPRDD